MVQFSLSSSAARLAALGDPGTYGKELDGLTSGQEVRVGFFIDRVLTGVIVPVLGPLPSKD